MTESTIAAQKIPVNRNEESERKIQFFWYLSFLTVKFTMTILSFLLLSVNLCWLFFVIWQRILLAKELCLNNGKRPLGKPCRQKALSNVFNCLKDKACGKDSTSELVKNSSGKSSWEASNEKFFWWKCLDEDFFIQPSERTSASLLKLSKKLSMEALPDTTHAPKKILLYASVLSQKLQHKSCKSWA